MDKQSLAWRIYAAFLGMAVGLPFLHSLIFKALSAGSLGSAGMVWAVVGVIAWAYGYRLGPAPAWRLFAVLFAVTTAWAMGRLAIQQLGPRLYDVRPRDLIVFTIMTAMFISMVIALVRYSIVPARADRRLAGTFA